MKSHNSGFASSSSSSSDRKSRSCVCSLLLTMFLMSGAYFIGSSWMPDHSSTLSTGLGLNVQQHADFVKCEVSAIMNDDPDTEKCKNKCRPIGSESLPQGIVSATSNMEMYPLTGPSENKAEKTSLLALAVGLRQKEMVDQIVTKFVGEEAFAVMLFHYDGTVDAWHDLEWSHAAIHVSAINQTKWWFAKRFLHPDIVAQYDYIFLWDEDLGLDNFHPLRYLDIIKEEGLEISQPALDPARSKVHHQITVRNRRSRVHRRYYKVGGKVTCDGNSSSPPCVGWVEMMAPVFSRAAWRCVWYMIQNDLIHAWGLDKQLGYCAQGDRSVKVGVVDEEYIVHADLPTLGGVSHANKETPDDQPSTSPNKPESEVEPRLDISNGRTAVRLRSYSEMRSFEKRWNRAVEDDECWVDPFTPQSQT